MVFAASISSSSSAETSPLAAVSVVNSTVSSTLSDVLRANSNSLSVAHLNVRSLTYHFSGLTDLVHGHKFNIIALSETWLRTTDSSVSFGSLY